MTAKQTINVSHLPPYDISLHAPLWWGQLMLAAIECTMFAILIAAYFYVRFTVDVWPPPGSVKPPLTGPTVCTLLLLASCIGSYWASEAAKKDDRRGMILGMLLNLVLAAAAMTIRFIHWYNLPFRWDSDIHGSFVWSFLGLHTWDVLADLVCTAVLIVILAIGKHGPKQRQGVHVDSVVWYALVGIWLPIYFTVYWGPRL